MNTKAQQIEEMWKILAHSSAVNYQPAYDTFDAYLTRRTFFISQESGILTIDYKKFAEDLYSAGYRKVVSENQQVEDFAE